MRENSLSRREDWENAGSDAFVCFIPVKENIADKEGGIKRGFSAEILR